MTGAGVLTLSRGPPELSQPLGVLSSLRIQGRDAVRCPRRGLRPGGRQREWWTSVGRGGLGGPMAHGPRPGGKMDERRDINLLSYTLYSPG